MIDLERLETLLADIRACADEALTAIEAEKAEVSAASNQGEAAVAEPASTDAPPAA